MSVETRTRVRVLIADDDPAIREILTEFIETEASLELAGVATRAEEAISLAEATGPDVVLMDVRMPGGGAQATARLRDVAPLVRVLALSAHADATAVTEMFQAGVVGYLVKGTPIDVILDAIHRAARGETSLSPDVAPGVVQELRARMERDRGEMAERARAIAAVRSVLDGAVPLAIHYQPVVRLQDRKVIGLEALARFGGTPPQGPDVWFRNARNAGYLLDLELLAARLALEQFADAPEDAYIAVNLSPETLLSAQLDSLLDVVPPGRKVVLEITEHAPIEDYAVITERLAALRERGVRLAVDDAGAGFASLRHILSLKPDIVKLDITLIRNIDKDPVRRALARALASFGAEIGATIIGEGVEYDTEVATLVELGVTCAQGYFLGRPAPLAPKEQPS